MKYKINDHAKAFLEENLPEALAAESSFEALKMLYALIDEKGFEAPKFHMDETITDFYQFTKDSFRMENYQYHPFDFEIPMAI